MPTLIDLRRRIRSVRNTQQITKAMKTVATARFRKAQRVVVKGRPHWHNLSSFLAQLSAWAGQGEHPLLEKREEKIIHGIVITSDKGLCGAFNSNLLVEALSFFEKKAKHSEVRLILVGKKAFNFFKKYSFPIDLARSDKVDRLTTNDLKEIARYLIHLYAFHQTDAVYVAYNEFKSILSPQITIVKALPILPPEEKGLQVPLQPDWEPEAASLFKALIPRYVEDQVSHFFFESQAAEQAARMIAMNNASKNAEELISDLILVLNKIRQASITKELLEIMTAVEALGK